MIWFFFLINLVTIPEIFREKNQFDRDFDLKCVYNALACRLFNNYNYGAGENEKKKATTVNSCINV